MPAGVTPGRLVLLGHQQQESERGIKHHRGARAEAKVAQVARRALANRKLLGGGKKKKSNTHGDYALVQRKRLKFKNS